jgi:phosphopantetheinyl transferase
MSVTSSDTIVLVAVSDVPVGVDVERCAATAFPGFDSVALSARERAEFGRSPALDRRTEIWVRKEAVLKVGGLGLSVPPNEIYVGRTHDGPIRVPKPVAADGWVSVVGVEVPDAYRAAVAVGGRETPTVTVRDGRTLLAAGAAAVRTATA